MRYVWTILIVVASCIGALASCYMLVLAPWNGPVCITDTRSKILDLSGYDFEVTDTQCSAIVHSEHMRVLAAKRGEWRRTLLFEYDPWNDLPTISMPAKDRIRIAVPRVSSIVARRYAWRGMTIEYDIGEMTYPGEGRRLED
ncbi:MAG: hypothetical protein WA418_14265 [Bradyrhizobium sp.]